MQQDERDRMLLSLLACEDQARLEEVIEEIIEESVPIGDPAHLYAAAAAFDLRAETLPDDEKVVAWQIPANAS